MTNISLNSPNLPFFCPPPLPPQAQNLILFTNGLSLFILTEILLSNPNILKSYSHWWLQVHRFCKAKKSWRFCIALSVVHGWQWLQFSEFAPKSEVFQICFDFALIWGVFFRKIWICNKYEFKLKMRVADIYTIWYVIDWFNSWE